MKKIKKILIGILSLSLCFFTIVLSFVLCLAICLIVPCKINNTNQYHNVRNEYGFDKYFLFPLNLDNIQNVNDFHYHEYSLSGTEIILDATYTNMKFEKEIERLNTLSYETTIWNSKGRVEVNNGVIFDNAVLFNLPTYITIYNSGYSSYLEYEYACIIKEENRIVYVFLKALKNEKIGMDELFLPKDYDYNAKNLKEFSIYKDGVNNLYE